MVNSESQSIEKQIILNSLEDPDNPYRLVFAVDILNEGWDVLNLFDIVRLYESRDSKDGKPGKTTVAEAQLIGRGARYCPFKVNTNQDKFKRKYDEDVDGELRVCEELYYHSTYNPKYIQELTVALKESGMWANRNITVNLRLKDGFKESKFYREGIIFINKKIKRSRADISSLPTNVRNTVYRFHVKTGKVESSVVFSEIANSDERQKLTERDYKLIEFGEPTIRKALSKSDFFQFNNLKTFLPNVRSTSQFIKSDDYLANIIVCVQSTELQTDNLSADIKLNIVRGICEKVEQAIISQHIEYEGTNVFTAFPLKDIFVDKKMNLSMEMTGQEKGIAQSDPLSSVHLNLADKEWYAFNDNFGTSEEKRFVKYLDKAISTLSKKYQIIYVLRNEKHLQIFTWDGKALEPDFVLFLQNCEGGHSAYYQIFIEPKGEHLLAFDKWKEDYLVQLKNQSKIEILGENVDYKIWGMPFYNENVKMQEFDDAFSELTK